MSKTIWGVWNFAIPHSLSLSCQSKLALYGQGQMLSCDERLTMLTRKAHVQNKPLYQGNEMFEILSPNTMIFSVPYLTKPDIGKKSLKMIKSYFEPSFNSPKRGL